MDFAPITIRAADKEAAKDAISAAFTNYETPHSIDWKLAKECAELTIDALEDVPTLDIVVIVSGMLNFYGDRIHHVKLAFETILVDRT